MSDILDRLKNPNCGNCRFGQPWGDECRRHAPTAVMSTVGVQSVFPRVSPFTWCGDHEPKQYETQKTET